MYYLLPMKRTLLILFLIAGCLLLTSQTVEHTPRRTPEQVAQKQTERLQRDLMLTQEQRDTVYSIHLKYARLRNPNDARPIIEQRIKAMIDELKAVLTEEQREAFGLILRELGPRRQSSPRMKVAEAVEIQPDSLQSAVNP